MESSILNESVHRAQTNLSGPFCKMLESATEKLLAVSCQLSFGRVQCICLLQAGVGIFHPPQDHQLRAAFTPAGYVDKTARGIVSHRMTAHLGLQFVFAE